MSFCSPGCWGRFGLYSHSSRRCRAKLLQVGFCVRQPIITSEEKRLLLHTIGVRATLQSRTYSESMSSRGGAALSAWPPSLDSAFCRSSEFIWRVLIFSVVFLTKLDTLREESPNKTTRRQSEDRSQPRGRTEGGVDECDVWK